MKNNSTNKLYCCTIKLLPNDQWISAATQAININPVNATSTHILKQAAPDVEIAPAHLALLTSKYWGKGGVRLTVGFLDNPESALKKRILEHMNAWAKYANVKFMETSTDPQVRISRIPEIGHWSYMGTDILSIKASESTMNLDSFTMNTLDSEFYRVVRHETGHTLGFPHEHMRDEIVNRIDRIKAIAFFKTTYNWSEQQVINQVLTPINNSALIATAHADPNSIMCYWLPGTIMKDGQDITGGKDIDSLDAQLASTVYPPKYNESKWITALYADILKRVPDSNGLQYWVLQRDNGASRDNVVNGFLNSPEYCGIVINRFYNKYLNRTLDPGGLQSWTEKLKQGIALQQIIVGFCDSVEYKSTNTLPAQFIESLYDKLLGRSSDTQGKQSWMDLLRKGHSTAEVIYGFLNSLEYCTQQVTELYKALLGRQPDANGLSVWVKAMTSGSPFQQIQRGFLVSDEYRNRALTRF